MSNLGKKRDISRLSPNVRFLKRTLSAVAEPYLENFTANLRGEPGNWILQSWFANAGCLCFQRQQSRQRRRNRRLCIRPPIRAAREDTARWAAGRYNPRSDRTFCQALMALSGLRLSHSHPGTRNETAKLVRGAQLSHELSGSAYFLFWGHNPSRSLWRLTNTRIRNSAECILQAMSSPLDQIDFSVVVKHRAAPPKQWRWEIYRAGRRTPIERSSVRYETVSAAKRAGREALKQLLTWGKADIGRRP